MNKKLESLMADIGVTANDARNNLWNVMTDLYHSMLYDGPKIKGKIRQASLEDVEILFKFYLECEMATMNQNVGKLKKLSNLELDTIIIEDYIDRKLLKLLIKYNELAYTNIKSRKI